MVATKAASGLRHLVTLGEYSPERIRALLASSASLKQKFRSGVRDYRPLQGHSMAMIFQKRSTRTRVSSETGMAWLGGHALFLGKDDIQLGVNESLYDTAKVLSGFNDVILARVFEHKTISDLREASEVPIINALCDKYHPLQILADLLTIQEHFGRVEGLKIGWVGDGNNIIQEMMVGMPKLGMSINVATPKGYEVDANIADWAGEMAAEAKQTIKYTNDPEEAVHDADVVVTDTWVSMGDEDQYAKRMKAFAGYQVNKELTQKAKPGHIFLHCLPRHKEEVSDEVFYSEKSLVFPEAENRMHTLNAVLLHLLQKD
eukprot:Clim_evm78s243 gene=Clim_evmTU78s243